MVASPAPVFATSKVAVQDSLALKHLFQSITDASCPGTYNFHMHTVCSDGRLQPEELMEQAISLQLKGLAITDHHTVQGYRRAKQWLEDWRWRNPAVVKSHASTDLAPQTGVPHLWTGIEVTSLLAGADVHILGYGFDPAQSAIAPYTRGESPKGEDRDAANVIAAIQAAGGLAVLAHPVRYRRSPEELIPLAVDLGIDGVEVYYAYDNPSYWRPSPEQTARVKALAQQYDLLHTCGTDTHGLSLVQRL